MHHQLWQSPHVLRHFFVLTLGLRHLPLCILRKHLWVGLVSKQVTFGGPLHAVMSPGQ